jgi:hypothetical protein
MQKIVDLVKQTNVANPVVIIFMSDGEAQYPSQELDALRVKDLWDKIESFWAVGFGVASPVLEKMANHFTTFGKSKGIYKNPKEITELQESYMEIARLTE